MYRFNRCLALFLALLLLTSASYANDVQPAKEEENSACSEIKPFILGAVAFGTFAFFYGRWVGFKAGYDRERREAWATVALFADESTRIALPNGAQVPFPPLAANPVESLNRLVATIFKAAQSKSI